VDGCVQRGCVAACCENSDSFHVSEDCLQSAKHERHRAGRVKPSRGRLRRVR
jgi:hypothetical protein